MVQTKHPTQHATGLRLGAATVFSYGGGEMEGWGAQTQGTQWSVTTVTVLNINFSGDGEMLTEGKRTETTGPKKNIKST